MGTRYVLLLVDIVVTAEKLLAPVVQTYRRSWANGTDELLATSSIHRSRLRGIRSLRQGYTDYGAVNGRCSVDCTSSCKSLVVKTFPLWTSRVALAFFDLRKTPTDAPHRGSVE